MGAIYVFARRVRGGVLFFFQDVLTVPTVSVFSDGRVVEASVQKRCFCAISQLNSVVRAHVVRGEQDDQVRSKDRYHEAR